MSRSKYDLPEPRPHEIGQESTAVAIFVGLLLSVAGLMGLVCFVLAQIMAAVLA